LITIAILCYLLVSCNKNKVADIERGFGRDNSYEGIIESSFEKASVLYIDSSIINRGITGGSLFPPLIKDKAAYILGSGGELVKFRQSIAEWIYEPDSSGNSTIPISNIAIDSESNVYFITHAAELLKIGSNGKKVFCKPIRNGWNDLEDKKIKQRSGYAKLSILEDRIIVSFDSGYIAEVDTNGNIINSLMLGSSIAEGHSSASDIIALAITNNTFGSTDTLAILDEHLAFLLKKPINNARLVRNPVVKHNRIYLAGTVDIDQGRFGLVQAYDLNGMLLWEKRLMNMPRSISVADDSTLYIPSYSFGLGSSLNSLTAIGANGETLWNKSYKLDVMSPLYITDNYLLCYANDRNTNGIYRFSRAEGNMTDVVSVSDKGSFHFEPSLGFTGEIYLARSDSLGYGYIF